MIWYPTYTWDWSPEAGAWILRFVAWVPSLTPMDIATGGCEPSLVSSLPAPAPITDIRETRLQTLEDVRKHFLIARYNSRDPIRWQKFARWLDAQIEAAGAVVKYSTYILPAGATNNENAG